MYRLADGSSKERDEVAWLCGKHHKLSAAGSVGATLQLHGETYFNRVLNCNATVKTTYTI